MTSASTVFSGSRPPGKAEYTMSNQSDDTEPYTRVANMVLCYQGTYVDIYLSSLAMEQNTEPWAEEIEEGKEEEEQEEEE